MAKKKTAIEKDFAVYPAVYFKNKSNAVAAQKQAKGVGLSTRLTKTSLGYKVAKISK